MADHLSNLAASEMLSAINAAATRWNANLADYPGVTQAMVDELMAVAADLDAGIGDFIAKSAAKKAARATKDEIHANAERLLRRARRIAKAGGASESAMKALGTERSTSRTRADAGMPVPRVDTSTRFQHTIHWTDDSTPDSKRKPVGAMGAEIWIKVDGGPPGDERECRFLTTAPVTPFVAHFDGADAGKMAHYLLRWRFRDGGTSTWGKTVSATITG
jgi:hypothetical protein